MYTARLLHISDLHLAVKWKWFRNSKFDPAILEELAHCAYLLRDRFELLLVSGDLGDSGRADDLGRAWDFLHLPPGSGPTPWLGTGRRPTLQAAGKPIILLPGNHDRYHTWPGDNPANTKFDGLFTEWTGGLGGVQAILLPDVETPALCLLLADFTLAQSGDAVGLGGKWGQGKVDKSRRDALVQETETAQKKKYAVVWIIHFAPLFENYYSLKQSLHFLGAQTLIAEAQRLAVRHVFCGHTHQRRVYAAQPPSDVWVHCAGTACCPSPGDDTAIHLVEIDADAGLVLQVREKNLVWDPNARKFQ